VVQNAFDQGFARSRGQARRIDPKIAFPPLKYCNNDGVACERDLGRKIPILTKTFELFDI